MQDDLFPVRGRLGWQYLLVLALASCTTRAGNSTLVRALATESERGVVIVVQQADCESRGAELRILASRLPHIPVVLLRTRGGHPSPWEKTVRTIFPETRHSYHITWDGAALLELGVSATPAFLEWEETSGNARGTPLDLNWSQMLQQIRDIEARFPIPRTSSAAGGGGNPVLARDRAISHCDIGAVHTHAALLDQSLRITAAFCEPGVYHGSFEDLTTSRMMDRRASGTACVPRTVG